MQKPVIIHPPMQIAVVGAVLGEPRAVGNSRDGGCRDPGTLPCLPNPRHRSVPGAVGLAGLGIPGTPRAPSGTALRGAGFCFLFSFVFFLICKAE